MKPTPTPKRPILRYHGGKWILAPWIISHFPKHQIYVEPFAGAASVLLRKERSYTEVYNDLDGEIVNVFRVMRSRKTAGELEYVLKYTPYSREEFDLSHDLTAECEIERARRTIVRSWFGVGTGSFSRAKGTGFRAGVKKRGTQPHRDWVKWKQLLHQFTDRLDGVVIESQKAQKVIERNDSERTLFYVDPPYPFEVRGKRWSGAGYKHELQNPDHVLLLDQLKGVKGMVIISGYDCEMYNDMLPDWRTDTRKAVSDGGKAGMVNRIEKIWISPNTPAMRGKQLIIKL